MTLSQIDRFIRHIMPDAPVGVFLNENPGSLPPGSEKILEAINCQTGVPMNYLERAVGLVLRGLAGLKCLWFLHGLTGELSMPSVPPEGVLSALSSVALRYGEKLKGKPGKPGYVARSVNIDHDWNKGLVVEKVMYLNDSTLDSYLTEREIKLGKWLKQYAPRTLNADAPEGFEMINQVARAFETRDLPRWVWKISAHPLDILTMSAGDAWAKWPYRRSWVSCMRPGEVSQFGPLTDMAAGSACLFWYRPGAAEPCGRTILRPSLHFIKDSEAYIPSVNIVSTIKGDGPKNFNEDGRFGEFLRESLVARDDGCAVSFVSDSHERLGKDGLALSRYIWDDSVRLYCVQTDSQYEKAYVRLKDASWPEPIFEDLDINLYVTGEMLKQTEGQTGLDEPPDPEEVADYILSDSYAGSISTPDLINHFYSEDHSDYVSEQWANVIEYIDWNLVTQTLQRRVRAEIEYRFGAEQTMVILVPVPHPRQLVLFSDVKRSSSRDMYHHTSSDPWTTFMKKYGLESGNDRHLRILEIDQGDFVPQEELARIRRSAKRIEFGSFVYVEPNSNSAEMANVVWRELSNKGWNDPGTPMARAIDFRIFVAQLDNWERDLASAPGGSWIEADVDTSYSDLVEEFGKELSRSTAIVNLGFAVDGDVWGRFLLGG